MAFSFDHKKIIVSSVGIVTGKIALEIAGYKLGLIDKPSEVVQMIKNQWLEYDVLFSANLALTIFALLLLFRKDSKLNS